MHSSRCCAILLLLLLQRAQTAEVSCVDDDDVTCDDRMPDDAISLMQGTSLMQQGSRRGQTKVITHEQPQALDLEDMRDMYLNNLRDTMTGMATRTPSVPATTGEGKELVRQPYNEDVRQQGLDWCDYCFTMAGGARVQNVRELVQQTIEEDVPGDFLEAGTWRGGCSIMARAVQKAFGEGANRRTYLCDSFNGLPPSSQTKDGNYWSDMHFLEVDQKEVEDNVKQVGLLDDNVQFRKGYFSTTMPIIRKELQDQGRKLAVLRGDGDMYESYKDILYNLYDFVPEGGYFICDDCPSIAVAKQAIDDFRQDCGINDELLSVKGSGTGMYWRKSKLTPVNYTKYLEWNETRVFHKK